MNYIIGFRSKTKKNMIIASLYYLAVLIYAICVKENSVFSLVLFWSVPFFVYGIKEAKNNKNYKGLIPLPICLLLMFVIANLTQTAPEVESIVFENQKITFSDINQEQPINIKVQPENAKTDDIDFIIKDIGIVKVENGIIHSLTEGETTIYALNNSNDVKSEEINIIVIDKAKQEERQNQANKIIEHINSVDENNILDYGEKLTYINDDYNKADEKVQELVTNKDKLDELTQKWSAAKEEERKKIEEEEKRKAEEEEKARVAAEQKKNTSNSNNSSKNNISSNGTGSSGGVTVYIGKTGNKYHTSSCPTLKGGGTAISLSEAQAQGRTACKRCH